MLGELGVLTLLALPLGMVMSRALCGVFIETWRTDIFRIPLVEPVAFTKVSALGVEEQRVLVIVDITSPKEDWLSLGGQYRVEARFILWEGSDVLQVPSSALFRHQSGWAVFAAAGETAVLRALESGKRSGFAAEVVGGLSEGDAVINHPSDTIVDGGLVEVH